MSSNQTFKANYPSESGEELLQSLTIAFVVPSQVKSHSQKPWVP